jgi:hypothetical protein
MSCCRSLCGIHPRLSDQICNKLKEICLIFPNTSFIAVLNHEGELLAAGTGENINTNNKNKGGNGNVNLLSNSNLVNGKLPEELLAAISSLKKTALQFGTALNQSEASVIHIRGSVNLFSCYEIDKNLLAFYSEAHPAQAETFNLNEADNKMQPILQDLRLLLNNLQT